MMGFFHGLLLVATLRHASSFMPRYPLAITRTSSSFRSTRRQASAAMEAATAVVDVTGDGGVLKTTSRPGSGDDIRDGSVLVVRFTGSFRKGSGETAEFAAADKMVVTVGDGTMIPGWDAALRSMKVGEVADFTVGPAYGYGAQGVAPVIPAAAALSFKVEVLDLRGNVITDATFADSSPLTPRTPASIKAEFERRQREAAPKREGLEGALDWVKSIYVFGFFESESGGELPWYLRPVITFPTMFAIVGVTFYVVIVVGGVTLQRDVVDLDTGLISSLPSPWTATSMTGSFHV